VHAHRVYETLEGIGSSLSVPDAGMPSYTTKKSRDRFTRDVPTHKRRVVVIQFGINDAAGDVWKQPPVNTPRAPLAEYEQNLRWMIATLHQKDAKTILMTTNPTRWTANLRELYGRRPIISRVPAASARPCLRATTKPRGGSRP